MMSRGWVAKITHMCGRLYVFGMVQEGRSVLAATAGNKEKNKF